MVFYRKYRPQTIDELDSEKVRQTLSSVLSSQEIPHAFLFTGPKGLGKTSTARIIAKVVNCTNRKEGEYNPCNTCDSCTSITNGTNIDVLEIDGASNRGIDEIRDLREKVRLAPSTSKKKIYIIDEVHMLTTEAFNALLKTIEEPPSHVMFLFCTTEPQKVPATILSRCFHIHFNRATDAEIVHSLKRICAAESIQIDDDALLLIANLADGGFRDAAKLLEESKLVAQDKKITKALIEDVNKTASLIFSIPMFMKFIDEKNVKECLTIIANVVNYGADMRFFTKSVLEELHALLLQKNGIIDREQTSLFPTNLGGEDIIRLVDLFSKAYADMKYAVIPQLPLEIAVITWCGQGDNGGNNDVFSLPIGKVPEGKPTVQSLSRKQEELKVKSILNPVKEEPKKAPENPHEQRVIPGKPNDAAALLENIIYKTKPFNHSVAAVLRGCTIKSLTDTEIVLEAGYKFHKERLDEVKTKDLLAKILKEITGKDQAIKVELKK